MKKMMLPTVSILIPIQNEARYIDRCLSAIAAQDYPHDRMEILVIDGMSTDDTREIVGAFSQRHPEVRLRLLNNPQRIVPTGINLGLCLTTGEVIIRVDGHCLVSPDYVRNSVEHLSSGDGVAGVGGPMESLGETRVSQAIAIGMSSRFGVGNSAFRTVAGKDLFVDTVPFPAYPRRTINQVGAYDEELVRNQDDEYNYRIREHGGRILLAGNVRSKYYSRSSLANLWRQFYQYGYWKVRVLQKHPRQMSLRQFAPPLLVLMLVMTFLLAFAPTFQPLFFVFPGIYVAANLAASTWAASRRDWASLPLLPLVYAVMHISYGLGFWVGMVRFIGRWGDKRGKTPPLGERNA